MLTLRPVRDLRPERSVDRFFEDAFSRFFEDFGSDVPTRSWSPPVDIYEEGDKILINVELPGFEKDEVDINVENGRLTLSGERRWEDEKQGRDYHRMERFYGKFQRSFQLPNTVDLDKVDARLSAGILTVEVPKREEAKPRQIKVKV